MRSDNGTNFVGAERELCEALASLHHNRIEMALSKRGIKWRFNPPGGSHHGGPWDRMIRRIRKILCSVLRQQTLDDEGFHTVLCEFEAMLNNRPITKISQDPNDLEALTSNHLLLLKGKPILPPVLFDKNEAYAIRRWKQCQYISETLDPRIPTPATGTPKMETREKKLCSWRPGNGHGLFHTTRITDAWKNHRDLP